MDEAPRELTKGSSPTSSSSIFTPVPRKDGVQLHLISDQGLRWSQAQDRLSISWAKSGSHAVGKRAERSQFLYQICRRDHWGRPRPEKADGEGDSEAYSLTAATNTKEIH